MVVKDEAEGIRRAIESCLPLVDDVVVHDTGSNDGTQDIVRELGGQVIEEPWRHDFSYHRNLVLRACRGDWIISIDGDEVLKDPGNFRETIDLAWQAKHDAVFAWVQSVGDNDKPGETERQLRAWDRMRCSFKYPIHNQLIGWRADRLVASEGVFWAYYLGSMQSRFERTVPPLLQMLEDNPEPTSEQHQHALCFLARAHGMMNMHEGVLKYARPLMDVQPRKFGFAALWPTLIRSTLALEDTVAGAAVIEEAIGHHPQMADLWYWRSVVDLLTWGKCCEAGNPYNFVPQTSTHYARNLPEAGALIGMPFMSQARGIA